MRDTRRWAARLVAALVVGAFSGRPAEAQAPIPPPAPDPAGPPNVFYGAVPPNPPYTAHPAVLVFLHGLHGVASNWWVDNDMYQMAFQAGFRTAFLSMNEDNTPNDASLEDNAQMLRALLPLVVGHYQTDKVVLIGHSKGGLDAQAAMLDPDTRRLVHAVFTISTPNTGTELADWAFGPGLPIAGGLGLLTPGVFSLQTQVVAAFRSVADPILQASGIPFFTLEGSDARGNPLTGVTGLILYGLTPGRKNDGFVPVPRGRLPAEWSTDLGEVKANHFEIDSGNQTFMKIHARLMALEYSLEQFKRIVANGFGDSHNNWMWSMEWFQGKLYVGTGREIQCLSVLTLDVQTGSKLYPLSVLSGGCPDGADLTRSIAGEIWRYDPETEDWARVFKSPESIPLGVVDGEPVFTARDVGFRGMTVFTEPDGTDALYVGGVTSQSVFDKLPQFAASGYPPPRLLRSVDGVNFEAVPQTPGSFLGGIGNALPGSKRRLCSFRALTPYKGMLFATVGDFRGVGAVIGSANPNGGDNAWFLASPVSEQFPVWNLIVFNDFLYATTGDSSMDTAGFGLYKTAATGPPPYAWTPIILNGGWQADPLFRAPNGLSFAIFKGQLYLGTNRPTELYRVNPDDSWDLIVGEPRLTPQGFKAPLSGMGTGFGSWFNGHFWRMTAHEGQLYLTTWDWSTGVGTLFQGLGGFFELLDRILGYQYGFDFFRTRDGVHWEAITRGGFLDGQNIGGRSILSTSAGLFVGTVRAKGGAQVYLCAPPDCTGLEPPAVLALPRRLGAVPEAAAGRHVVLSWEASPGAVKYRVYRATVRPAMELLAGNVEIPVPGINMTVTLDGILAGQFDYLCAPATPAICEAIQAVRNMKVGVPMPFVQVGIRRDPQFIEPAPTSLQSIYFVRAEDAEGNLSAPSNFVGAPSKAPPGGLQTQPPTVTASVSPGANEFGWNNTDVTVSWTITTPGAGLASSTGCESVTVSAEGVTTLSCSATNSSDQTTEAAVVVRIDKTPPTIVGAGNPAPNAFGWNSTDVTVTFTCSDGVSGVAQCGPTSQVLQGEGAGQSRTATATDLAGNAATAQVGPINIDKTAPEAFERFDPESRDLKVFGRDRLSGMSGDGAIPPSSVVALSWGGHDARRRTFLVRDLAGNTLQLIDVVKTAGDHLHGRIDSLTRSGESQPELPANSLRFEWSDDRKAADLRNLEQRIAIEGRGHPAVRARYDRKTDRTTVIIHASEPEKKQSFPGLLLLRMATEEGGLSLEYLDEKVGER